MGKLISLLLAVIIGHTVSSSIAEACSVSRVATAKELIKGAKIIVRALASEYEQAPQMRDGETVGPGRIKFKVVEVLKGGSAPDSLIIDGYLSAKDDFNDRRPPYNFVREGGRYGNCFAFAYKSGAEFLLFLQEENAGLTPYWSPLAATNEQITSASDPWLLWVRKHVKRRK